MKEILHIAVRAAIVLALFAGCTRITDVNPYAGTLNRLTVRAQYPDSYGDYARQGVAVSIEEVDRGSRYTVATDATGTATLQLANGIYRITITDRIDGNIFNGTHDKVRLVDTDLTADLPLLRSQAGALLIKEIYCGGCMRAPQEGNYQSDKYLILHNNSPEAVYLDSLCFGALDPYNSQANNVWITHDEQTGATQFPDFVPLIQAVWQFGGDGRTFPLAPGEDAVLCCCGAIDHAAQYPQSVNLNRPGYFVLYNNAYFPNTLYHPAPGDCITPDRYLNVVIKTGVANAYPFSIYSPAPVIFRTHGTTIQEFVQRPENVVQKPGSKYDFVVKVPLEWIVDGAEVFYGGSSSNAKRLSPTIDAGYVVQHAIYKGVSLHRHVDEEASAEAGYEILVDTNNSTADFYQRAQQSLHD